MGKDFFDEFDTKVVLSVDATTRLNELLQQLAQDGSAPEAGLAQYAGLLKQLLAEQGADIEAAKRDNPGFIYLEAATDMQQFQDLLSQTGAAAACATKSAAEAEAAKAQGQEAAGTWEPPPADANPETDEDYQ